MSVPWFLYMIQTRHSTLYTGVTTDVERRLSQHASGKGAKYLRGKAPLTLVFHQEVESKGVALSLEAKVKKLTKVKKLDLISGRLSLLSLLNNKKEI